MDDNTLCQQIRDLWCSVDKPELIQSYYQESTRVAQANINSIFKEFAYNIYPRTEVTECWSKAFYQIFASKAIIFTHALASREAKLLGFTPVQLDYNGRNLTEYIHILKNNNGVPFIYYQRWNSFKFVYIRSSFDTLGTKWAPFLVLWGC